MSGQDNLQGKQFKQLPMFMTPQEVGETLSSDHFGYSMAEAYPRVRAMSEHAAQQHQLGTPYIDRLKASVEKSGGIEQPVSMRHGLSKPMLENGHHRATVAHETDRLIPVQHHEGSQGTVWLH